MRALTVAPGIANSAGVEDVPEPPESDGAVLVRTLALGVCGTDREIVAGLYGWAPPGRKRLIIGHESLGTVEDAPVEFRIQTGRSRCRHRAPPGSGAMSVLRRRRMGHVPQWPLHRTRHQGARRLRLGIFPRRTRILGQARSIARLERRPGRADQHRRQGMGPHRTDRPPLARLVAEDASGYRRRPDRFARRNDRRPAWPRRACARPQ